MKEPARLYRYRSLDKELLEREVDALEQSYLFSPMFNQMNDPMEAFYQTGGPDDRILDAWLAPAGKNTGDMYALVKQTISRFALVSFASNADDLPMWAYYGSNFAGMCLEFDTEALFIGDFQNEKLREVTYARTPLPPFTAAEITQSNFEEAVIARLTRKRSEWSHEKEWRFITGECGRKHYLDDALTRVFLGPRINPEHERRICEVLKQRPVEILKGEVNGFELSFNIIKPACSLHECEAIGGRHFDSSSDLSARAELRVFLEVPFVDLVEKCQRTALRPNMERFFDIAPSGSNKEALYVTTVYKLRSGREVYHKQYFDRQLRSISNDPMLAECSVKPEHS